MNGLRILVVEDQAITAMDLQETLQEAGHTVVATARTYQEAIDAFRKYPVDLALIDIQLNGSRDGIDTAKELLAIRRIPIIYLTANSEIQTFQSAKETLPSAYLLKPFQSHELKLQIELAYHNFENAVQPTADVPPGHLFLPIDKGYEKIDTNNVLYLKADGSYVRVFMVGKETVHHISTSLSHLAQYFPQSNFFRLSRSLLVNINHIERLESNYLYMVNHKIPIQIPVASRKELMKKLTVIRTK
ncbi:response regulator [Spirosoma sp. SC4-14]|uniref:response regulator n=1 Tax=Spirosoma sp. SC4-14 TaxID=3128900 RepID=UPI0030CB7B40